MLRSAHRRVPGFHAFIVRRVGEPRHVGRFALNWFLRPLSAGSFSGFWRSWNPVYGYVLTFYVYRPLRSVMPEPLAVLATFLVSGFFLHDVPFGSGLEALRGEAAIPEVTVLMAIFGVLAVATDRLGVDLSGRRRRARVVANCCLLLAGFALRRLVVGILRGPH
jgi:hypothetical protein